MTSRVEVVKPLVCKAGFSREVAEVVVLNLGRSAARLYQGKWSRFLHLCRGRNISPCKANILQIAEFFVYLPWDLKLSVPSVRAVELPIG